MKSPSREARRRARTEPRRRTSGGNAAAAPRRNGDALPPKTENAAGLAREADILVAAAGRRESVGAAYFRAGQTVIDVGIHYNEETQKLCGDVALAEADGVVRAVTPVPGGVGALTRYWPRTRQKPRRAG